MHKASTTQVRRILLVHLLASIIISTLLLVIDQVSFWSGLTGGLIATLANGYFAWKVFYKQLESKPEKILARYYGAEVGKIILTVMLFSAAILMIKPINIIALLGVYLFNTMIPWLVSYLYPDDSLNLEK